MKTKHNPSRKSVPSHSAELVALYKKGDFVALERKAKSLLAREPRHGTGLHLLGLAYLQQGKYEPALDLLRRAKEVSPNDLQIGDHLAIALAHLGRQEEALRIYQDTIARTGPSAVRLTNMGAILRMLGKPDKAEQCYQNAVALDPQNAATHFNLANTIRDNGRYAEAVACYKKALAVNPRYGDAGQNLGILLKRTGRLGEAEVWLTKALTLDPDNPDVLNNLASVQNAQGRIDEAEASYRRALAIKPDYEDAFGNLLFALNYHPDKSGEEIFEVYREYDARFGLTLRSAWRPHGNSRETQRRLKVGYVSPDFKAHSVRYFLEPLLAHHDRDALEVYAYAELEKEDEVTARYKKYVDHWVVTSGMSDTLLAERIQADGIDILVDLAGHSAGNRLGVFARKPAPLSVSWLGYGYSTGLTAIDYILTDEVSAPPSSENFFAEKPWRLGTTSCVYRPAEGMGEITPLPAMGRGYVTFGTLSRRVRINHHVIRVWAEILQRVDGARLVIDSRDFLEAGMQDALAEKFALHGIGRDRLQIGCHSPPWDVLRDMDIGLDGFPHNSGTTLIETLYMGVPYVTLAGRPSVGRLGSMVLEGVGHPEWIARSEREYVEIAVSLARDLPKLAALRAGLRKEMEQGPLMDEPAFARKVEGAYREMFGNWARG